ncbi:hypothetical protein AB3S75_019018 [Citrus x aurantiifolia]
MEARPPVRAKKLCRMVRVILFMIQKGVTKSKFIGKALNDAVLYDYGAISCRSHDMHASFVCPREYEFSCSNSPAYQPYVIPSLHVSRRKILHRAKDNKRQAASAAVAGCYREDDDVAASDVDVAEASPLVGPVRRGVRVTDSPFPLRDDDKDCHVDKEAEEFIKKFYQQLRLQKWNAAREAAATLYG